MFHNFLPDPQQIIPRILIYSTSNQYNDYWQKIKQEKISDFLPSPSDKIAESLPSIFSDQDKYWFSQRSSDILHLIELHEYPMLTVCWSPIIEHHYLILDMSSCADIAGPLANKRSCRWFISSLESLPSFTKCQPGSIHNTTKFHRSLHCS